MAQSTEHLNICIPDIGYNDQLTLGAQNISIQKSGWTCILGHSGSGKTTFLSWLAGLLSASHHSPLNNHEVSLLSQKNQLLPWKKAIDQVYLGDLIRGTAKDTNRAEFILNQVGMHTHATKYPYELSQGMKQRVALARVIYENRPYILLDEPFSSLDIQTKNNLYDFIHQHLLDKTIIHVTHDIIECLRLADEVFILKGSPAKFIQSQSDFFSIHNDNKPRCSQNTPFWQSSINLAQELNF